MEFRITGGWHPRRHFRGFGHLPCATSGLYRSNRSPSLRGGRLTMIFEIFRESWAAFKRSRVRSFLTMLGIVWGIAAVTLLISYGSGFRSVLVHAFFAFGRGAVVCWPQQTSEQPGGQRAGKVVKFEQEDVDLIRSNASLVKMACLETVKFRGIAYNDSFADTAIRGVCPQYGEMRNEVPREGRWISSADVVE